MLGYSEIASPWRFPLFALAFSVTYLCKESLMDSASGEGSFHRSHELVPSGGSKSACWAWLASLGSTSLLPGLARLATWKNFPAGETSSSFGSAHARSQIWRAEACEAAREKLLPRRGYRHWIYQLRRPSESIARLFALLLASSQARNDSQCPLRSSHCWNFFRRPLFWGAIWLRHLRTSVWSYCRFTGSHWANFGSLTQQCSTSYYLPPLKESLSWLSMTKFAWISLTLQARWMPASSFVWPLWSPLAHRVCLALALVATSQTQVEGAELFEITYSLYVSSLLELDGSIPIDQLVSRVCSASDFSQQVHTA